MRKLKFYDSMKELLQDKKKLEKEGHTIIQVNKYNVSMAYHERE